MPLVREDQLPVPGGIMPMAQPPAADPFDPGPSLGATFSAAWDESVPKALIGSARDIAGVLSATPSARRQDPDYDPLRIIRGTRFEAEHADEFLHARSDEDVYKTMGELEARRNTLETLNRAGWSGVVAQVGLGFADPLLYIPFVDAIAGANRARGLLTTVSRMATLGAVQAGLGEIAMQSQQTGRSAEEGMWNIASGTILSGLLGSAVHGLSRAEHGAMVGGLDELRADVTNRLASDGNATARMPRAAGAAASDLRELKQVPYLPKPLQDISDAISPTGRIWSSESVEARRALGDLAGTPRVFEDNKAGIPTTSGGTAPVDISAGIWTRTTLARTDDTLTRAYVDYRYGPNPPMGAMARANVESYAGRTPEGVLTPKQFKEAVYDALYMGDKHEIPQVQATAEYIRRSVLDPVKKAAQETIGPDGRPLLGEATEAPDGDLSFAPRHWSKEAITRGRDRFVETVTTWLRKEQQQKAIIQDALRGLRDREEELAGALAKKRKAVEKAEQAGGERVDRLYAELEELEARHASARQQIEEQLAKWRGKSTTEAMSAIRARAKAEAEREAAKAEGTYQGKGARMTSADDVVDRTVKHIVESDRGRTDAELRDRASQIADRIISTPDGRLPYDEASVGVERGFGSDYRGSLQARDFAIPTELVKEFVNRDPVEAAHAFLRLSVPDILLTQKFGDVNMTMAQKKILEEYAAKIEAASSAKERVRLEAQKQTVLRDLTAIRDRVRGVYGFSPDPGVRRLASISRAVRSWGTAADLGSAVPNSLTDAMGATFRYGLTGALRSAWMPFFKSLVTRGEFNAAAKRQAKAMGLGLDTQMALHGRQLGDVIDYYKAGSGFEKFMGWAADKSMIANGLAPWTDLMKTMVVSAGSDEILRMCSRVSAGKATARDVRDLAAAYIDESTARRIWRQHEESGVGETDGVLLPDTEKWTDTAARDVFEAALNREADIAVVTPGQEKPLFLSRPVGALLGQFRSFTAAAHERVFIANLQRRDARTLSGVFSSLAAGMVSYKLYSIVSGRETSDRPQDWIKEAINRSGVSGWISDANAMQAKFTGGKTDVFRVIGADKPLSRYAQRSALSEFLGPTYSRLEKLQGPIYSLANAEWKPEDTHALRQMAPLQNHFAFRRLLDKMEGR